DRGQRVEGNAVLVAGDAGVLEAFVSVLAGEAEGTKIDESDMRIGASSDKVGTPFLETVGQRLGVGDYRLRISLELRLQRLAEGNRLGGDDVHQRSALKSGKDRGVDLLGDDFVVG